MEFMNFVRKKSLSFAEFFSCFSLLFCKKHKQNFCLFEEKNKIGKTLPFSQKQLSLFIFSAWLEKTCFKGMFFHDVFTGIL